MSHVGKNIKKIRSVKNLNQTQFAELFDLKRASIGAYEEGRAEPKIATLSQIAKYFGISVDDLLHKELSVNDLFHFDIFQKDYVKNKGNQLKPSKMPVSLSPVYYIAEEKQSDYFKGVELNQFIKLNLPLPSIKSSYLAFEAKAGNPWLNAKGESLDMLICRPIENKELEAFLDKAVILYQDSRFIFGQMLKFGSKKALRDFRHGELNYLDIKKDRCFLALYELANSLSKS